MGEIIGYILIATEVGQEHDVAKKIWNSPYRDKITDVTVTYGIYDIVVRFDVDSFAESNDIVTYIRNLPGVRRTETLLGFPVKK